jgi:hypothetical protein
MEKPDTQMKVSFLVAFCFWATVTLVIALCSGLIANWPESRPFPWTACIAGGVAVLLATPWYVWRRGMREEPKRSRLANITDRVLPTGACLVISGCAIVVFTAFSEHHWPDLRTLLIVLGGTLVGTMTLTAAILAERQGWVSHHIEVWQRQGGMIVFLLVISAILAFSTIAVFHLYDPDRKVAFIFHVLDNPGGAFAIVMGVCTLAGVFFTLQAVVESQRMITTFPQLLQRLCELIRQAKGKDEYIRYLCYTPLTGVWAAPKESDDLRELIQSPKYKFSMVILRENDLKRWFERFQDRVTAAGEIKGDTISEKVAEAEALVQMLKNLSKRTDVKDPKIEPKRLTYEQMPGFYFFCNDRRAIIVSPVFLPLPEGTAKTTQVRALRSVQVVGIDTTDPHVVDWIKDLHQVYRDKVASACAETFVGQGDIGEMAHVLSELNKQARQFINNGMQTNHVQKVGVRLQIFSLEQ